MSKLDWNELLSDETEKKRSDRAENDARSPFESDYDRIAFSAPFRRLQDKAQVFPLKRADFVRTRLTHSVEVAALGKSMGRSIEKKLCEQKKLSEDKKGHIPAILESAGLAHDLGNPPYGHYGEKVIQAFFKDYFEKDDEKGTLTDEQRADFMNFDGNCQTLRILTNTQCIKDEYGFHLTYGTLATIMKYPFDSVKGNKKEKNEPVYKHKFGYYQSEEDTAGKIFEKCGLGEGEETYRHPLAFVLEAADDIAYSAADLEDGFKKGCITLDSLKETFCKEIIEADYPDDEIMKEVAKKINEICNDKENYYSEERKIQEIRIYLQGVMVREAVDAFVNNIDSLLDKSFDKELLEASKAWNVRKILKDIAFKNIITNSNVQKAELAGGNAIEFLLKMFTKALDNKEFRDYINDKVSEVEDSRKLCAKSERIYNLISEDNRKIFEKKISVIISDLQENEFDGNIRYNTLLMITDYISGMTDGYCLNIFKELKGI